MNSIHWILKLANAACNHFCDAEILEFVASISTSFPCSSVENALRGKVFEDGVTMEAAFEAAAAPRLSCYALAIRPKYKQLQLYHQLMVGAHSAAHTMSERARA